MWVGGVGGAEKVTFLLQLSDGVCEAGGVVGDVTGGDGFVRGYLKVPLAAVGWCL